jgi:hypothetical protein
VDSLHRIFSMGMVASLILGFALTANATMHLYRLGCQSAASGFQITMTSPGSDSVAASYHVPFGSCVSD